jgi:ATP-dependent DNA ligase
MVKDWLVTPARDRYRPCALAKIQWRLPEGHDCRYEVKLDGFRAIARKSGLSAQFWSCDQKDLTRRYGSVAKRIFGRGLRSPRLYSIVAVLLKHHSPPTAPKADFD